MKTALRLLVMTLLAVALIVVPSALAKGKPSWAGQGNGGGHGKPAWAGQGHGREKAKAAHEKKAKKEKQHGAKTMAEEEGEEGDEGDEDEGDPDELSLEDLQALEDIHAPGQYCHALESMQDSLAGMFGGETFDEHFGENDNLANSFGKCASWRAQGGELSEEEAEEESAEDSCPPAEEEGTEDEATEDEAAATEEEGDSEEPAEDEEAAEEECDTEEPADEEPAADENGDEDDESEGDEPADDGSNEDESFTMTVTVEVDLSFLGA